MGTLETCGNGCGLIAALIGCVAFGSFGAPLKCTAVNMVNGGKGPDPFVLQTYKSSMYFLTSWVVLLLGVDFEYTNWGLVSGFMWVTGGVCGIFGIRNAGLAVSVGTWSSITVLISFSWGIFFFNEQVQSVAGTVFGVLLMIFGFIGMAYFSSLKDCDETETLDSDLSLEIGGDLTESLLENGEEEMQEQNEEELREQTENEVRNIIQETDKVAADDESSVFFLGIKWDRIVLGILGAAIDGVLGGSNLIPMKLAPSIDRGLDYVISFAIGAAVATLTGWIIYFFINSYKRASFHAGYKALPSMYLDKILLPGALSGLLWSIGNVCQILSVTFLGESIGMSIVQSQMIISGLLGIVLFEEIKSVRNIVYWVLSALLTFVGIVFLSREHKG